MPNRSGFAQLIKVVPQKGDEYEVLTHLVDYVHYERAMKKPLGGDMGVTDILWLAWAASVRTGVTNEKNFERWYRTIDEFEAVASDAKNDLPEVETDGTDDADPTQSDQSTDPS